jgi:DNA-binding MarR family transcriptional regulator
MLASHLLDTIPSIMREWRRELHEGLPAGLSINQFRVLFFVSQGQEQAQYLARHLGVTPAAMSKMIEALVQKKLLRREPFAHDRRQIQLQLTASGKKMVHSVRGQVELRMQRFLDELPVSQQDQVQRALLLLQKAFASKEGIP